jgi:hypothetical protein
METSHWFLHGQCGPQKTADGGDFFRGRLPRQLSVDGEAAVRMLVFDWATSPETEDQAIYCLHWLMPYGVNVRWGSKRVRGLSAPLRTIDFDFRLYGGEYQQVLLVT